MAMTAIFIDGGYLNALLKHEFSSVAIDYEALVRRILGSDELLRTYYYHCLPFQSATPTDSERTRFSNRDRFLQGINRLPQFDIRLGKLLRQYDREGNPIYKQKRVDTPLSIDLVLLAVKQRIARAVLITGDSDFLPAVRVARDEGVVVALCHGTRYHNELWDACDERIKIDDEFIRTIRPRQLP